MRLNLANFVKAKATTGLPYAGLVLYYTMVYLLMFRRLQSARYVGELLQRIFGTNYSVNSALAAVYRQMWNFEDECKALMDIVPANRHDIDLLHRAGETAAFAGDVNSLERLRDIAALESPSFLSYLNGLLAYLNGQANYQAHFQESVKAFFSLAGVGSSDASGKSMSILMKSAIKSGRHIPEFVRMAYNIRELSSIDELLMTDCPSPEPPSLPDVLNGTPDTGLGLTLLRQKALWLATGLNGILGFAGFRKDSTCVASATPAQQVAPRLPASPRLCRTSAAGCFTDPIVLISCSDGYLKVFADYYTRIFRRKNQNIIHFHVLAEDVEVTRDYLVALKKKHSNIRYSIEAISGRPQTYITLARFLICRDLMKHYNRDVLISDIDFHPDFNLSLIGRELRSQGCDFGLCDAGYSVPWAKFAVGFSYFRVANHATDVYLGLLARHLTSLYSDGGFFSMDQVGALLIYEYMQARGHNFRMLNLFGLIDLKGMIIGVPKQLQRGKIKCKFEKGGPQ